MRSNILTLSGMALGGIVGWFIPRLIPTPNPSETDMMGYYHLRFGLQILGLCIGGSVGLICGTAFATRFFQKSPTAAHTDAGTEENP
jgi:hypothetical protein